MSLPLIISFIQFPQHSQEVDTLSYLSIPQIRREETEQRLSHVTMVIQQWQRQDSNSVVPQDKAHTFSSLNPSHLPFSSHLDSECLQLISTHPWIKTCFLGLSYLMIWQLLPAVLKWDLSCLFWGYSHFNTAQRSKLLVLNMDVHHNDLQRDFWVCFQQRCPASSL